MSDILSTTKTIPNHIGIIMDGNGRWAKSLGKVRTYGHQEGLKSAKRIVQYAAKIGVKVLTLYAFSTENWKRTEEEVSFLMGLILTHLKKELNFYKKNGIQVRFTGDISKLPKKLATEINDVIKETAVFNNLIVVLAINYGGRDEIVRAVNKIIKNGKNEITEQDIQENKDNPDILDPDLIIRTAGEHRLSNFLLWGSAYSEYFWTDTLWPLFDETELDKAIDFYSTRDRKFGGIINK